MEPDFTETEPPEWLDSIKYVVQVAWFICCVILAILALAWVIDILPWPDWIIPGESWR